MTDGDKIVFDDGSEGTILWHKDMGTPCPYAIVVDDGMIVEVSQSAPPTEEESK